MRGRTGIPPPKSGRTSRQFGGTAWPRQSRCRRTAIRVATDRWVAQIGRSGPTCVPAAREVAPGRVLAVCASRGKATSVDSKANQPRPPCQASDRATRVGDSKQQLFTSEYEHQQRILNHQHDASGFVTGKVMFANGSKHFYQRGHVNCQYTKPQQNRDENPFQPRL